MDSAGLRALQAPIKDRYKAEPQGKRCSVPISQRSI